jgi:hypothetical protein
VANSAIMTGARPTEQNIPMYLQVGATSSHQLA